MKFSKHYLSLQDYFLTKEKFDLFLDSETELLKTVPQPVQLDPYYESEDYLSHDDSQKSFFAKCYNFAKTFNVKSKVSLIKKYVGTGTLLDIGAGVGDLVAALRQNGVDAKGFEPSGKARAVALSKGIQLVSSLDDTSENTFDVVSMYHVLEHVPDIQVQIEQLKRLLKKDGYLILALPNYNSFDARFYKMYWAGFDVPRHLFHFNKKAVHTIFQKDFEIVAMKPMWFDSFYVSILSEKYKKGSLSFAKGMIIGLWSNLVALFHKEASSITYVMKKRF